MSETITIRRAESIADYHACQGAQRRAWGFGDEGYVVPVATMVGAQLHGGLVLGAFLPGGEAVGMSFAFLGRVEGRLCLYSQLTGVIPGYQSHGIGARLKYAQRDYARAEGLPLIAWAFDPLQAGNAWFNLGKLGATAGRYVVNMYGPRADALNAGLPTDRLIAEWETKLHSREEVGAEAPPRLPRLIETGPRHEGVPAFRAESLAATPRVLLEVPEDVKRLGRDAPEAAEHWRLAVRQGFLAAFAAGYRAVGFLRIEFEGHPQCFYVLKRGEA